VLPKEEELSHTDVRNVGSLADLLKLGRIAGVGVGSSRQEVRAAFGEPEAWILSDEPRSVLLVDESRWWRYGVIQVFFDRDEVRGLTVAWPLPRYTLPVGFEVADLPPSPPTWDDFYEYLQRQHIDEDIQSESMGTSGWVRMMLPSGVKLVAGKTLISISVSRID
jgi:hypothetical protein